MQWRCAHGARSVRVHVRVAHHATCTYGASSASLRNPTPFTLPPFTLVLPDAILELGFCGKKP
eukprot:scaffold17174_cov107-Isochrysis_galbana.AAC.2